MKVHYKSILDEMREAIEVADSNQRTILNFELSAGEWNEFQRECDRAGHIRYAGQPTYYLGVLVRKTP